MIIINDFFKRNIEAVSNQMEAALKALGGKIISARRFMGQKALQEEDLRDNIFVFEPEELNEKISEAVLTNEDEDILVFEEEPCKFKVDVFNKSNKNVYVAMYRKPYKEYMEHLMGYKKLKKVFVELESHKKILVDFGFNPEKIVVTPTPAKLSRQENQKKYTPNNVSLVFASWNNTVETDSTQARGLLYLVDCLEKFKNLNLVVVLRDNQTKVFTDYVKFKNVQRQVKLVDVKNDQELTEIFDSADFVVYFLQEQIVKDVPNSLIDGISRGKPILMTDVLSFSEEVKKHQIGKVFKKNDVVRNFNLSEEEYMRLSQNAYEFSAKHTVQNYMNVLKQNVR